MAESAPIAQSYSPAVVQSFTIVDCLETASRPLRLSEISQHTQLPKSSTYRLLNSLVHVGAVRVDEKGYRLGPRISPVPAVNAGWTQADLVSSFYRSVAKMGVDETLQLAVLQGNEVVFIACVDSQKSVRLITEVGRRLPVHSTAAGKILLARQDPSVLERVLASPLTAVGPHTITDPQQLRKQLAKFAQQGWSWEREESATNLSCVAAPITATGPAPIAAVTLCTPHGNPSEARKTYLATHVVRLAQELSGALSAIRQRNTAQN